MLKSEVMAKRTRKESELGATDYYLEDVYKQARKLSPEEVNNYSKLKDAGQRAKKQLDRGGLTVKQREELEEKVAAGKKATDELVKGTIRLVFGVAKKYQGQGVPFGDLVQEGNTGLLHGVEKYNWRRGNRISTYVSWWIRQAITRSLPKIGKLASQAQGLELKNLLFPQPADPG